MRATTRSLTGKRAIRAQPPRCRPAKPCDDEERVLGLAGVPVVRLKGPVARTSGCRAVGGYTVPGLRSRGWDVHGAGCRNAQLDHRKPVREGNWTGMRGSARQLPAWRPPGIEILAMAIPKSPRHPQWPLRYGAYAERRCQGHLTHSDNDQKTFQVSFSSHAGGLVRARGRAPLASHGVQSDQRLLPVAHL